MAAAKGKAPAFWLRPFLLWAAVAAAYEHFLGPLLLGPLADSISASQNLAMASQWVAAAPLALFALVIGLGLPVFFGGQAFAAALFATVWEVLAELASILNFLYIAPALGGYEAPAGNITSLLSAGAGDIIAMGFLILGVLLRGRAVK